MEKLIVLAAAATVLFLLAPPAFAFRCGEFNKYLAYEGMHKYQILKDCGPPTWTEDVGIDNRNGSYRVLEEWLYVVNDTGHNQMYLIKFDRDGIAQSIEWLGTQD